MVDFTFSDDNKSNNNKNAPYTDLEDRGFDFDFVNTSNSNKGSNTNNYDNFNKQISKQEIKENFEDFVWTSSFPSKDMANTQQVKTNNNNNNFFEFNEKAIRSNINIRNKHKKNLSNNQKL